MNIVSRIGVLRAVLAFVAISIVVMSQFTGDRAVYEGWRMVPTLIVPAIVPIVFFVLLLDMLMSGVFMADAEGEGKKKFKFIIMMDLVFVLGVATLWFPYFYSIANR
ncbi:MAG: hypothetical protein OEY67_03475 [Gammaproteobacteria bacterium]|nr:hypothetical protein [Gammaproteobacteria bacterium]